VSQIGGELRSGGAAPSFAGVFPDTVTETTTVPKVKFLKEKKEVEVEAGANLRDVAIANGIQIHHHGKGTPSSARFVHCSVLSDLAKRLLGKNTPLANIVGGGFCGTCHVYIKNGTENCSPPTVKEKLKLKMATFTIGHEDEVRLACQTQVLGDIEVETAPLMNWSGEKFWTTKVGGPAE
jgi:2Fe-2S ferredoxin